MMLAAFKELLLQSAALGDPCECFPRQELVVLVDRP
jgi:hypothetical protein